MEEIKKTGSVESTRKKTNSTIRFRFAVILSLIIILAVIIAVLAYFSTVNLLQRVISLVVGMGLYAVVANLLFNRYTAETQKASGDQMANELSHKYSLFRTVTDVANVLMQAEFEQSGDAIVRCMNMTVAALGVDRGYLRKYFMEDGKPHSEKIYEYIDVNAVNKRDREDIRVFSDADLIPNAVKLFMMGLQLNGKVEDLPPEEREMFTKLGVTSVLLIPLYLNGKLWGVAGYDSSSFERSFTDDEVSVMRTAMSLIVSSLLRLEANERTRLANENTKFMIDSAPIGCLLWTRDEMGKLVLSDCNAEQLRIFGVTDKNKILNDIYAYSPPTQPDGQVSSKKSQGLISRALETDERSAFTWIHRREDGTLFPTDKWLQRVKYGDEYILASYMQDISEREQMMSEIAYKNSLFQTVTDVATILMEAEFEQFDKTLKRCVNMTTTVLGVDRGYVRKNFMKDGELYCDKIYEWIDENANNRQDRVSIKIYPYSKNMPNFLKIFSSGRPINDIVKNLLPAENELFSRFGALSVLEIPILVKGEFWGFIGFDTSRVERCFTDDEVSLMFSAAALIVNAIMRHETDIRIRETNERIRIMLEAAPYGCTLWGRDDAGNLRMLDSNQMAATMRGLKTKQELFEKFYDLSPEYQPDGKNSKEETRRLINEAIETGHAETKWVHLRADGSSFPAEVSMTGIKNAGEYAMVSYMRDTTDKEKLLESVKYKTSLFETVNNVGSILLQAEAEEFEGALRRCMEMTAGVIGADRVYIRKNYMKDGRLWMEKVYEWISPGSANSQYDTIKDHYCWEDIMPNFAKTSTEGKQLNSKVSDLPDAEREVFTNLGILSLLLIPVFIKGDLWGVVGFDSSSVERSFTDDEASLMHAAAVLFVSSYLRNGSLLS